jgi:hypothetical protein
MSTYTDMAPKTLKHAHYEMLLLDATGASVKDIANATGYSPDMVYCVRKSEAYQQALTNIRTQIQTECVNFAVEKLNRLALKAVEVLEQTLQSPETPWRQKLFTAREVLKFVSEHGGMPSRPSTTPEKLAALTERLDRALDAAAKLEESS